MLQCNGFCFISSCRCRAETITWTLNTIVSHNSFVWISDKISKCHLYSHRGTRTVSIVCFFNGLFATQPNNCTIFPMHLPLSLCFLLWSSAYWQTHRLKRRKMANQISGIWTLFIFSFFSKGYCFMSFLGIRRVSICLPAPEPNLTSASWMLLLPRTQVMLYTQKLKLLKSHLLKCSVTMFLDFFFCLN